MKNGEEQDADIVSDLIQEKQESLSANEAAWEQEKVELIAQADALKAECSELQ